MSIKVADEVWIGCALLHKEQPNRASFSNKEIINRIKKENLFGTLRVGVQVHVNLHCVANLPANPAKYRMLYKLSDGTKRLFSDSDDYHPSRENGRIIPEAFDVPETYRYLLNWYIEDYSPLTQQKEDKHPDGSITVESVELPNEKDLANFSYNCPVNFSGICKECQLFLSEDEIKKALIAKLKEDNWRIEKTAMGNAHGVDIAAVNGTATLYIEAKGEGSLVPMRINYFLAVLGELLQKMDDPNKQYAIALPAYQQYSNLISRLPLWVKQQLKLQFFIVKKFQGKYVIGHICY